MNKYPRWKYILIIILVALAVIYALPNIYGEDPAVQISTQSGSTITQSTIDTIKQTLQKYDLSDKSLKQESDNDVLIRFKDAQTQLKAQDILKAILGDKYTVALNLASTTPTWLTTLGAYPMKLGLDLRGGVHFLLAIDTDSLIQRRINGDMRSIGNELRQNHIRYSGLTTTKDNMIIVDF